MESSKYISPSKITKQFDITSGTLRQWAEDGKIRFLRPNNGRRIYNVDDIAKIFGRQPESASKKTVLYARVSSSGQKEDLERQIEILQKEYPNKKDTLLIKDVASGLNWNRPGFSFLLELVHKGDVEQVVVTYKDRLCRFGYELVEWILKKASVKLLVLGSSPATEDPSRELSEDLLTIVNVFVAKNNGLRAGQLRKLRQSKEDNQRNQGTEESTQETNKDSN